MESRVMEIVQRVVEDYDIKPVPLSDIGIAIVEADYLHGTNEKKLNIDLYLHDNDTFWSEWLNLTSTGKWSGNDVLPRVQQIRIIVDSLLICMKLKGVDIGDAVLTMPSSKVVANIFDINLSSLDYPDEDECMKILESICPPEHEKANGIVEKLLAFPSEFGGTISYDGLELSSAYKHLQYKGIKYVDKDIDLQTILCNITKTLVHNYCTSSSVVNSKYFLSKLISYRKNIDMLYSNDISRMVIYLEADQYNTVKKNRDINGTLLPVFIISHAKSAVTVESIASLMYAFCGKTSDLLKFKVALHKLLAEV